jgi:hypothetical protein
MANITVSVTDANNITVQLTPVASQTITIDRGVAGNGISSIVPVTISTLQYLRIYYTNGTQADVGPLTSTAYFGETPITIVGNTISLSTVPINKGGTNAITAAAAIQNLLPSYTGNGSKRLGLNSGATALEWVADGGGTVTSVDVSGGTTGLTTSGGPITGSGIITLAGTLAVANGGTGKTTAPAAMANLMGFTSTATAAGTTTLTNTSSYYQLFTGTTTQTIVLPVTSTLQTGWTFHICNNSTGSLTVNSSGGNLVITVIPGTTVMCTCIGIALTTAADWESGFTDFTTATGTGAVVLGTGPSLVGINVTGGLNLTGTNTSASSFHTTQTTGVLTIGGTAGTGNIFFGQSTASQTTNIQAGATASGSTKTINFGTAGLSGSTTAIAIGSAVSGATSTTTLNGTVSLANALAATSGGTGQSTVTTGDLLYGSAANTWSKLADVATGNALISGGVGVAPSWGKIGLTTHVSGTLPTANGGTNLTAFNNGGIVYASSTSVLATGSALTFDGTLLTLGTSSAFPITGSKFSIGNDANSALRLAISNQNAGASALVGIDFEPAGGGWKIDVPSDTSGFVPPMYFKAGASTNVTFAYGGNVGIGTSLPSQPLHVSKNQNASTWAYVSNTTAGTGSAAGFLFASDVVTGAIQAVSSLNTGSGNGNSLWIRTTGAYPITLGTNSTVQATLDASGNLGLGVTPSAWSATFKAMQVGARASLSYFSGNDGLYLANNSYYNGTNQIYIATGTAAEYQQTAGQHIWKTAPSGTAGNAITFTQAMTLDASGNLGVGTTTPKMELQAKSSGGIQAVNSAEVALRYNAYYSDADRYIQASNKASSIVLDSDANIRFYNTNTASSSANSQITGWSERARIDSSGNLGLQITPAAWFSNRSAIQLGNSVGNLVHTQNELHVGTNFYSKTTTAIDSFITAGYVATDFQQANGAFAWRTTGTTTGAAGATAPFSTAMTLDASGNLGIGVTSPIARLNASGGTTITSLTDWNSKANTVFTLANAALRLGIGYDAGDTPLIQGFTSTNNARDIAMQVYGGNLLVGTTSQILSNTKFNFSSSQGTALGGMGFVNTVAPTAKWQIGPDSAGNFVVFNGSAVGVYVSNGGTSWTAYSDERLKTTLIPFKDAVAKVATLRAGTGRYLKDAEGTSRSFLIAQDVQKVLPEAVDANNPDALGLSYTDVIPLLVAAIQEQQALINQLTARITALEGA